MTESGVDQLPWQCPDHPDAPIRREWDQTHVVLNGYPAGTGYRSSPYEYFCNVCRRQLAPPTKDTTQEPT